MKRRIYTDTSVIGGCLDEEFRVHSGRLFEEFQRGRAILVVSELTLAELAGAPAAVQAMVDTVARESREYLPILDEAIELSNQYLEAGVVPAHSQADAQHIAMATIARVDLLVSWNFKHVVNINRIRAYNAINLLRGYPMLEIRTPREVLTDADND